MTGDTIGLKGDQGALKGESTLGPRDGLYPDGGLFPLGGLKQEMDYAGESVSFVGDKGC